MYRLPTLVTTVDDSKLLNLRGGPMVIISASGMSPAAACSIITSTRPRARCASGSSSML
jgi:hypothetical protein